MALGAAMNAWGFLCIALVQLSGACIVFIIGHHVGVERGHQEARLAALPLGKGKATTERTVSIFRTSCRFSPCTEK
jgi:hypothetical protein